MQTTRDLTTAIAQARRTAEKSHTTVYVVPGYYGLGQVYRREAIGTDRWIEVEPNGSAVAVETRWENAGKIEQRTPLA